MTTGKLGAWGLLLRSRCELRRTSLGGLSTVAPKGAKVESSQTISKNEQLNILQTVVFPDSLHASVSTCMLC